MNTGAARSSAAYGVIDAYIEQCMRRLKIPGVSLAIIEGDQIVHLRGFGKAQPDGRPPTPQTPFMIGSVTKSVTALAVMQLVETGRIELDAPVQRYLPWFRVADPQASAWMTVRHLLNQTSGLPTSSGEIPLADFDATPGATERRVRALATLKLTHPVGAALEYSNANYNVLGLIVESASSESYADYVANHIFMPLEMSHTYCAQAVAQQNGLATGYRYWFAIPVAAPHLPIPHGSLPSGWLFSCAEDMARYAIAHLNGGRYADSQILSEGGIDTLHSGVLELRKLGISAGKYGMGWFDATIGRSRLLWHGGIVPNYFAYMALLPGQKKGFVLLANADQHWMSPVLTDVGMGVAALLAGEQPARSPFGVIPWALRALLLIPTFQIVDVAATLRLLRRPRPKPGRGPDGARAPGLLPSVLHLLFALTLLIPFLGKRRGYRMLYMPDIAWVALVCGSFSLVWSALRTGLVLWMRQVPSRASAGRLQPER